MAWFELDMDMPDDPKCEGLAARLKNPLAFGYVVRLYAYCYRHGTDRFSGPGAPATIENAAKWRGRPGHLLAALVAEGFVDHAEGETLVVHGVGKRLAPHVEKKARDAQRMRERRANIAPTSRERSGDVAAMSDGCSRDYKNKDRDREEAAPPAPVVTTHTPGAVSSLSVAPASPPPTHPQLGAFLLAYRRRIDQLRGPQGEPPKMREDALRRRIAAAVDALTPEAAGTIAADEVDERIKRGSLSRPPTSWGYLVEWLEEQAAAPVTPIPVDEFARSGRRLSPGCVVID